MKNPKITPYVQYIPKLCRRVHNIEFRHTPRTKNELVVSLATITSIIKHPDTTYIDPIHIAIRVQPVHCSHVEVEPDCLPWYLDIKKCLEFGTYLEDDV